MRTIRSDWTFDAGLSPARDAADHDARFGSTETDPETVRRARLAVASAARDHEDCRDLLEMLGLLP